MLLPAFLFVFRIKPDRLSERSMRWSLLSRLIEVWMQLYRDEQGFLVEVNFNMSHVTIKQVYNCLSVSYQRRLA